MSGWMSVLNYRGPPFIYGGLHFAYVKTLLYDLLRITPKVELLYKLKGIPNVLNKINERFGVGFWRLLQ
jgi:hypothetical protein